MSAGCAVFIQNRIPDAIHLKTAIDEEVRRKETQEAEVRTERRHQALLSEQQRKTWLQRKVEWFENHRYRGPALLIVFIMSFVGGIINFGTTVVDVSKRVFFSEVNAWPITLSVQNLRTVPIEVGPLCRFELIEHRMAGWTSYFGGLGDVARLSPVGSVVGTTAYIIMPNEIRDFLLSLPANETSRELLTRRETTIEFRVDQKNGREASGRIPFKKDLIRRAKAVLKFAEPAP